jgi:hypothetical protein
MQLEMFSDISRAIDAWFVGTALSSKIFSNHLKPTGSSLQSSMLE